MSGLILCNDTNVKNPYPIAELGISLHTAEELCYYIYNYVFLLESDFINEPLLYFIGTELAMPKLEEKIRKWIADQSDMAQILFMILQDIHYYSEAELGVFKTQLEWMRRANPSERAKKKADYLLQKRKYAGAIHLYDSIIGGEQDKGMTKEFMGALYHNKGVAYAGLFEAEKALECMEKAYESLEKEEILKEIFFLCQISEELELPEAMMLAVPAEQQFKWKEEFDTLYKHLMYSGKGKELEELWEKDSIRRKAGIQKLLSQWKQEYREMAKS
ncbi:hypothetical protein [Qiania dongpingensis]|uniref:Tetratricopeptide repeat protein n=1 Tax=Qiania dongpingensis TaxID=2763669 RepID=A0A7G9G1T8_9FIRM|nr:hypothetical protein [Qiania dongpingensis]QNM04770.1 hypothetical protein H9Q78_09925 [Qiania dongpingensis]